MNTQRKVNAPVVIIGGGIVGCATAYYLAQAGVQATLLEKSVLGNEASGRNGGGVRQQCRDRRERALAMASVKLWVALRTKLGFDIEYNQGGNIRMATTEQRMDDLRRESEEELQDGLAVEMWDRETLRRRAPYLGEVFIGGKYCATDGTANPLLAPRALGWAAKRLGATIMPRTEALHVQVQAGHVTAVIAKDPTGELVIETPRVIHAGGPWTPQLAQTLGVTVPIVPTRSVVAVTQRLPHLFDEFISSHDLGVYARQAREGHVHVGGAGAEHDDTFDQTTPLGTIEKIARGAAGMIPALRHVNFLRTWAGTIENTPDKVAIMDTVDGIGGYIIAAGFSGHGFCLGPIAGKLLTEWLVEGEASMPLEQFRLTRFQK